MALTTEAPHLLVETAEGPVRGSVHNGVRIFRGIPYAAPPTGARRLRLPEPPVPWDRVLDAAS